MVDDELRRLRFLAEYQAQRPHLERLLGQLLAYFEELRKTVYSDPIHRIHSVRGRVKDGDSLWRKWQKKVLDSSDDRATRLKSSDLTDGAKIYQAMVGRFSDIIGVRVVCNTLAGKSRVCARIEQFGPRADAHERNLFSMLTRADQYYKDSGYRSVHFDGQVEPRNWPALALDAWDDDEKLTIEIQVRTILEEAWGEIQHDLLYKPQGAEAQSSALFLALSHRLHEADLNVQRLTRQLEPASDEKPPRKPSVQESIPANTEMLPLEYRASAHEHLVAVESCRRARDYQPAIHAHDKYLADLCDPPRIVTAIIRAERALDCLRLGERMMAKEKDASELLKQARLDYDEALASGAASLLASLLLWRRSRVRLLLGDRDGAISDLQHGIELSADEEMRYETEPFYRACLYRSLTSLLWQQAQDLKPPDLSQAEQLRDRAFDLAMRGVEVQREAFQRGRQSEACALHYCDVLNNAAWLTMVHKKDLARAESYIEIIERRIPPSLWEHDVYLLGTRLRLKVTKLQRRLQAREPLEIGHIVEADALRTQLFQALDEDEEYVPDRIIQSMLSTVRDLDEVWQSFLGRP